MRKIIHIDMDAFYASVEQRDFPELRGKAIAVGGGEKRGVVMTASYEAREFGVKSAMPSALAHRKCPQIIFVPPRFQVYQQVSQTIRSIFNQYTDLVEPLSLDEAYLDVTENKKNAESAVKIAREIKAAILRETQLTASAGISINKFLAKVASDYQKPDGISVILPHQVQSFIDQLPIRKFHGIGKVTAERMQKLGIHQGADLKAYSQERLVELFGKHGIYYYEIAHGIDERPVNPHRIRKSVSVEDTFENDLTDKEAMRFEVLRIARKVMHWMDKNQTYGRTLTLKIKFFDFQQITRSKTHASLIDTFETAENIIEQLLEAFDFDKPIRLLGVGVSNLNNQEPEEKQLDLDF